MTTPGTSFDPAEESCKYMVSIFDLEHGQMILRLSVRHTPFKLYVVRADLTHSQIPG